MSIAASKWAWDVRGVTPVQKVILLCIADHANKDGENAFPGIARIADECCMDRSTAMRNIEKLVDAGLLVKIKRTGGEGGGAKSNLYSVPISESRTERQSRSATAKVALCPTESRAAPPEPSVNHKIEPPEGEKKYGWGYSPQGVDPQAWQEWTEYKRGSPAKATITKVGNTLAKYPPDIQQLMVDNTICGGWKGLYPLKGNSNAETSKRAPNIDERRKRREERIRELESETDSESGTSVVASY